MKKSGRILVGKALRNAKKDKISREDLARAIRTFKERGGCIKELPPQNDDYPRMIGSHISSPYEVVIDY